MNFQEQCRELQDKIAQKNMLEGQRETLRKKRKELEKKVFELECKKDEEQRDVEQAEGMSLTKVLYTVIGKQKERVEWEKMEAQAALDRYEEAVGQLREIERQLDENGSKLGEVRSSDREYRQLLDEGKQRLKEEGGSVGEKIMQLEEMAAFLKQQKKEIDDAIGAGKSALGLSESILGSLDSAESWGTWDLLGGGLISDLAKHDHLNDAQRKVEQLRVRLRQFKTELKDIQVSAPPQVQIDGFLHFADFYFDGLFADLSVLNQIQDSISDMNRVRSQLKDGIRSLTKMKDQTESALLDCSFELEELVKRSL
ncbi:MAG: hypothetical protein IJ468_10950 [Lachnospiraceae bacterium]|nr:hypothetical protein [Lachnospiraceae bacterium]